LRRAEIASDKSNSVKLSFTNNLAITANTRSRRGARAWRITRAWTWRSPSIPYLMDPLKALDGDEVLELNDG
jgi:hypothetical protein